MNLCTSNIDTCISVNCDNPIYKGVDAIGWIFNRSEVDVDATLASGNLSDGGSVVKSIVMKTHTVGTESVSYTGFTVQQFGKTPFTGTTTEMAESTVFNKFNHTVAFVVSDNSPAASQILKNLARGRFIFILNNDYNGSDTRGKYQVFGLRKGLTASAIACEKYNDETDGGWSVSLTEEGNPIPAEFLEHSTGTPAVVDTAAYIATITDDCED